MTQDEQKVQELLKPRYKIIADYPHSPFPVGRLLDGNDESFLVTRTQYQDFGELHFQNNWMPIDYLEKFPHLFRKLEWFDERDIEDMPDYVRCISEFHRIIKEGRVYKVVSKGSFDDDMELNMRASKYWCFVEGYERRLNYSHFVPATSADHTAYIEKQPTTLNQGV